jgi:hypothetical protein
MCRNIFIENTRVIAFSIFIIINLRPLKIKPINSIKKFTIKLSIKY